MILLRVDNMITVKKILWAICFLLIIFELGLAVYLTYESNTFGNLCVAGKGCDLVQNSSYAYLFGIKLAYIAIVAFVFLLITFFFSKKIFALVSIIGSLFAIYFISIQLFVLKHICSTCILIDSTMIVISILAIVYYFLYEHKAKKETVKKLSNKKNKSKKSK